MSDNQFCCNEMTHAIENEDISVVYSERYREYGIAVNDGGTSYICLVFCPWCGKELPKSLRDAWFDEIEKLGLEPYSENIPNEFFDKRWYSTRKIG